MRLAQSGDVFNPLRASNDIRSLVFSWVCNRSGFGKTLNWHEWSCNPRLLSSLFSGLAPCQSYPLLINRLLKKLAKLGIWFAYMMVMDLLVQDRLKFDTLKVCGSLQERRAICTNDDWLLCYFDVDGSIYSDNSCHGRIDLATIWSCYDDYCHPYNPSFTVQSFCWGSPVT